MHLLLVASAASSYLYCVNSPSIAIRRPSPVPFLDCLGGFGSARLAGWSRATPTDQKELLQRLRPEVQCTFGPTPPQGTQILVSAFPSQQDLDACGSGLKVLVIPFAGLPVATKNLVTDAGFIKNGLRLHNVHHNSSTTAEMAVALGLAAAKQLLPADRSLRKGDWSPRGIPSYGDPDPMFQLGLDGQTALVLGYGEVGRRVSRAAKSFPSMRIVNGILIRSEVHLGLLHQ
ncbi:Glyoxylate reductase [Durusdinium trenchii]|uniref:Glyoxylate reductase n=1 Tax=Durusdinium trenchii TaxID=1381693 RepID=A0ABP0JRK1_9DINO